VGAIHWHANPANRVEYVAIGQARETIPYVKVTDESGRTREYASGDASDEVIRTTALRTMDCIDCHNTVGHPMMPTAERVVDAAFAGGRPQGASGATTELTSTNRGRRSRPTARRVTPK
jgi:hypothetical protein